MPEEGDLQAEWRALRGRNYGEEGIPVILAVETAGAVPPRAGEAAVAAAFRRLADALAENGADPAAILELIAAREQQRLE